MFSSQPVAVADSQLSQIWIECTSAELWLEKAKYFNPVSEPPGYIYYIYYWLPDPDFIPTSLKRLQILPNNIVKLTQFLVLFITEVSDFVFLTLIFIQTLEWIVTNYWNGPDASVIDIQCGGNK